MNEFSLSDFFSDVEFTPAQTKKAETKAPAKTATKATEAKTPAKEQKYKLPIKVVSGYTNFTLEGEGGEGEVSIDELKEKIFEQSKMLAPAIVQVVVKDGTATVKFRNFKEASQTEYNTEKNFVIVHNGFEMDLSEEAFDEEEANSGLDEETASELPKYVFQLAQAQWTKLYPWFRDADYLVDDKKQVVVPVLKQNLKNSIQLPITVEGLGIETFEIKAEDVQGVSADGHVAATSIRNFLTKKFEIDCGLYEKDGHYYLAVDTEKNTVAAAEKEELYPTDATVINYGNRINLTADMFGGKTEVSSKELLKWIASDTGAAHPEYNSERGCWIDFDKKLKLIIPRFKAARKGGFVTDGYKFVSPEEGYKELAKPSCHFNIWDDRKPYHIERTPIGVSKMRIDRKGESPDNEFAYTLPKIPTRVWMQVSKLFKKMSLRGCEAIAQILFDTKIKKWSVIIPEQYVSATHCDYDPSMAETITAYSESEILVMDIHSHHTMYPYWSTIDDQDEQGTRLYAVWGNHDYNADYEICVRAGCQGRFCRLAPEDIFEGYADRMMNPENYASNTVSMDWLQNIHMTDDEKIIDISSYCVC